MKKATDVPSAIDGGYGWVVLFASFLNQVMLFGYVKAVGVLFVEWQATFNVGSTDVGWVGIIIAICGPTAGLIAGGLTPRFGCRPVTLVGGAIVVIFVALTSFCNALWQVYILSAITTIGLGFAFQPSITVVGFYFGKHLGIANGIAISGVGAGIIVMPPFLQFLSNRFEWNGALLICSAVMLTVILCCLTFRPTERERYFILQNEELNRDQRSFLESPLSSSMRLCRSVGLDLLWSNSRFTMLNLSYAIAAYGYDASVVFFSSRAVHDANIPKQEASYLVSAIGIGSTIGRAANGFVIHSKYISSFQLYIIAGTVASISSYLNPFCYTFLTLFISAFIFGLSSGTQLAVALMCAREIVPAQRIASSFGVLILCSGVGVMFGTFTMGFLNDLTGDYKLSFIAAGTAFALSALITLIDLIYTKCCSKPTYHPQENVYMEHKSPRGSEDDISEKEKLGTFQEGQRSLPCGAELQVVHGQEQVCMISEPESSV